MKGKQNMKPIKIVAETPYGRVEATKITNMTTKEVLAEVQKISETMCNLTLQTKDGPVVLLSECARRSLIRVVTTNEEKE